MLHATVAPCIGDLPRIAWRWEAETDILSGSTRIAAPGEAATALEISSPDGAVVVLDVIGGELCGLDVVIWPEAETVPGLEPPGGVPAGRLRMASGVSQDEADLAIRVDGPERTVHLRIGPLRPARAIRVADHLLVELDEQGALAGCWLTGVPPFPTEE